MEKRFTKPSEALFTGTLAEKVLRFGTAISALNLENPQNRFLKVSFISRMGKKAKFLSPISSLDPKSYTSAD
tara:strand:+ start:2943 stop:3158 length:216 start_codon:yes stop_codon:yes gene_type:complete